MTSSPTLKVNFEVKVEIGMLKTSKTMKASSGNRNWFFFFSKKKDCLILHSYQFLVHPNRSPIEFFVDGHQPYHFQKNQIPTWKQHNKYHPKLNIYSKWLYNSQYKKNTIPSSKSSFAR